MSSVRDKQNANLMGPRFVKGVSGNPGGRKKGVERRYREVVEVNEYTARNGQTYKGVDALVMVLLDIATNPAELGSYRRAAVDSIVDRGWGKVKEQHEISGGMTPEQSAFFEAIRMTPHERAIAAQDATIPDEAADDDAAAAELVGDDDA